MRTTNAVESHNRLSKSTTVDPLDVAMLSTYKTDMVAALRHLASLRGLKTTYEDLSEAERLKRSTRANKTRRKRRGEDDGDGPPDKKKNFDKGRYLQACVIVQTSYLYTYRSLVCPGSLHHFMLCTRLTCLHNFHYNTLY